MRAMDGKTSFRNEIEIPSTPIALDLRGIIVSDVSTMLLTFSKKDPSCTTVLVN